LDSLKALVGLKPLSEFILAVKSYMGLREFLGGGNSNEILSSHLFLSSEESISVRKLYEEMMKKSVLHPQELQGAVERVKGEILKKEKGQRSEEENLFLQLEKQYGSDVGLFSVFLFNLIELKEGEGIFLNAGIPHAYLKGNIIECMANSDNVVRAGLTQKFKDIDSLLKILSFDLTPVEIINRSSSEKEELTYEVPASEFRITRWKFSERSTRTVDNYSVSILLIIEGNISLEINGADKLFKQGDSILIPWLVKELKITFSSNCQVFRVSIPQNR
ncbi:MAG: mannose-6-phosphate isomerase, class I, partial [Ignavibacteria bacterium]|nr:mannose-6-phosphate isomerase, class I [Ignavibacteria bacterium]